MGADGANFRSFVGKMFGEEQTRHEADLDGLTLTGRRVMRLGHMSLGRAERRLTGTTAVAGMPAVLPTDGQRP